MIIIFMCMYYFDLNRFQKLKLANVYLSVVLKRQRMHYSNCIIVANNWSSHCPADVQTSGALGVLRTKDPSRNTVTDFYSEIKQLRSSMCFFYLNQLSLHYIPHNLPRWFFSIFKHYQQASEFKIFIGIDDISTKPTKSQQ